MTDLEKIKDVVGEMLGFGIEMTTKENEIEMAVYEWSEYIGSVYFNLDGSLINWKY